MSTSADGKIISRLFFSLLPVQILMVAIGSIDSIIDGTIASNLIGPQAMAVIGLYMPVLKISETINAVMLGGSQILCGQFLGKNQIERTRSVFSLDMTVVVGVSLIMTGICFIAPVAVAHLLHANADTMDGLVQYILGMAAGLMPQMMGVQLTAYLQMEQQQYVPFNQQEVDEAGKRSAILNSAAIGLYILCPVPCVIFQNTFGVVLLFLFVAAATCLLIYNKLSKPYYRGKGQSIVDDFRIWQNKNSEQHKLYDTIHGALWMVVVVLYLAVSFLTGAWGISWLIFLIGAALDQILRAIFDLMEEKNRGNY